MLSRPFSALEYLCTSPHQVLGFSRAHRRRTIRNPLEHTTNVLFVADNGMTNKYPVFMLNTQDVMTRK